MTDKSVLCWMGFMHFLKPGLCAWHKYCEIQPKGERVVQTSFIEQINFKINLVATGKSASALMLCLLNSTV